MPYLDGNFLIPPDPRWLSGLTASGIGVAAIEAVWRNEGQTTRRIATLVGIPETTVTAILSNKMDTYPQTLVDEATAARATADAANLTVRTASAAAGLLATRWR